MLSPSLHVNIILAHTLFYLINVLLRVAFEVLVACSYKFGEEKCGEYMYFRQNLRMKKKVFEHF